MSKNSIEDIPEPNMMVTLAKLSATLSTELTATRDALLLMANYANVSGGLSEVVDQICAAAGFRICVKCREKSNLPSDYLKVDKKCKECGDV